jgi:hypothetical protein
MKNIRKTIAFFAALPFLILTAATLQGQMVSPAMDRPDQPFSYFSKPTDEIGVMDAEAATEITPEGYLRTGYGELMFFAGTGTGADQRARADPRGRAFPDCSLQF